METKETKIYNLSILIAGAVVILPMVGFLLGFVVATLLK